MATPATATATTSSTSSSSSSSAVASIASGTACAIAQEKGRRLHTIPYTSEFGKNVTMIYEFELFGVLACDELLFMLDLDVWVLGWGYRFVVIVRISPVR